MQSISFGMRANHPKFGKDALKPKHMNTQPFKNELGKLVDNATAILEKKPVQEAFQQTSQVLEKFKELPGVHPVDKMVISAYQKALPVDNKHLATMGNGMTQALKKINHRMAQPGFANQAAGRILAMNHKLDQQLQFTQVAMATPKLQVMG